VYSKEWLEKGHMKLIEFIRSLGMSEITGKVIEIFQGEIASGRNRGEPFWSITLKEQPDEKLTCFSDGEKKGWIEGLEQDKDYTFVVKASGKYINIVGQTVPCEDVGGDMREETGEEGEKPVKKKLVKVATKRKPPVVTSTMNEERKYKNRISALSSAVEYICATDPTVKEEELMECADRFLEWLNK